MRQLVGHYREFWLTRAKLAHTSSMGANLTLFFLPKKEEDIELAERPHHFVHPNRANLESTYHVDSKLARFGCAFVRILF